MSKFIDYLGNEALDIKDENGNTLFHYAVGCLDEQTIYKMMERGASLMSKNCIDVICEDELECLIIGGRLSWTPLRAPPGTATPGSCLLRLEPSESSESSSLASRFKGRLWNESSP